MHVSTMPWTLSQIAFDTIDKTRVEDDETLFFVIASASLIESGSDLYTSCLVDYFGASEAAAWLAQQWEPEELQHGRALQRYVAEVWPQFDWQSAFTEFMREYSLLCTREALAPTPTLELVARCVVETGTAALYRALHDYTDEPVLKQLTGLIRGDEVRHYKHFHHYFQIYNRAADYGRWPVLRVLGRRMTELRNEDADCALRHVFRVRYSDEPIDSAHFHRVSSGARSLVIRNISTDMMVKMFLQPLQLPAYMRNLVQKPCAQVMRHFMVN